ncbi:hypothetical protein ACWGB8_01535 [Kitasatospora sp. NPDC054939]
MSAEQWELLIVAAGTALIVVMVGVYLRRLSEHLAHCCTGQCPKSRSQARLPRQRTGGES